jgi:hypothetical protein
MKALGTLLTTLVLVACGGGGGGGGSPAVATGQFTDSPVKGLQYRTASQSGETSANGEFRYLPGETVTFFVGDITLGAAIGAAKVTPFDIAGIAAPTTIPNSGQSTVAFDQAINLAIFLQTLDADGNPANGIEIPAQTRTMTSGVTLDFKQARYAFTSSVGWRKLVTAGRTAGLVHIIPTPTRALQVMYATLGITPVLTEMSKIETIDPISAKVLTRTTFSYDGQGDGTQVVFESDQNGLFTRSTDTFTFDVNGNITHADHHWEDGISKADSWTDTTFDDNGNSSLSIDTSDNNGDGTIDSRGTTQWTFNLDGYLTEVRIEFDDNNDGTIDSWRTRAFSYDTNGNRTLTVSVADGVADYREETSYDAKGNMTLMVYDSNGDGILDKRIVYTLNATSQLTLAEEVSNLDGTIDKRTTYTYGNNGRVTLADEDSNNDGSVDIRTTYAYDAQGHRTRKERDDKADGYIDQREIYTYDANGYPTLTELDRNGDGVVDQKTTFEYVKIGG